MAFKYLFTKRAENDLSNIINYISNDLSNRVAAKDFYDKVIYALEIICDFPFSCQIYNSSYLDENIPIRQKIIGNYSLFYKVDEQQNRITVLALLYSKRNIQELLKNK